MRSYEAGATAAIATGLAAAGGALAGGEAASAILGWGLIALGVLGGSTLLLIRSLGAEERLRRAAEDVARGEAPPYELLALQPLASALSSTRAREQAASARSRELERALADAERLARAFGAGELHEAPVGEGAIYQAFGALHARMRGLIQELSGMAGELEGGTHEILQALRFQEQSAHEQAGAVEETRRTMESLLEASEHITSVAEQVNSHAERTRESNQTIAHQASQLNELTGRITDALRAIRNIADRSDILALNAALEGTKAGEAGKGFILVAEEMRRLAENVQAAVQEIQLLIASIREASQQSVLATEEGVRRSEDTARSAEVIRLTSQQQQGGTTQVNESMNAISNLLSQTAVGAQECTEATAELNRRAGGLQDLIAGFRLEAPQ